MPDINTVLADILVVQNDAYATPEAIAANVGPSPSQQIATLTAGLAAAQGQVATLTTELATASGTIAALQAEIAKVKTDVAADLP